VPVSSYRTVASHNGATLRGALVTTRLMSTEQVRVGTRRTLEKFLRAGVPVVVLRDTPLPPFNIPACVGRHVLSGLSGDFDASAALNDAAFRAERAAADGLANVYFLDMNDLICPGSVCLAIQHELPVYRDDNHLTGSYAGTLAPMLRTRLFELLKTNSP
jgi:SGNH domain (fused to AT3 domains)